MRPTLFLLHCVFVSAQHPCRRATYSKRWSAQIDIAPLVVVIDNAERLGDPKTVAFLTDTAVRLHEAGHPLCLWRAPRFYNIGSTCPHSNMAVARYDGRQGRCLVQRLGSGHGCQPAHMAKLVCAQCDGHIGMLLLCRTLIATPQSAAELGQLLSVHQADPVRGFFDSLVQQLLSSQARTRYCFASVFRSSSIVSLRS